MNAALFRLAIVTTFGCSSTPQTVAPKPAKPAPTKPAVTEKPPPSEPASKRVPGTELRLTLSQPASLTPGSSETATLVGLTAEEIAENPDNPESYPAGSGVVIDIDIAGDEVQLSELSEGYDSKTVAWIPGKRIELVRVEYEKASVVVSIHAIDETNAKTIATGLRLEKKRRAPVATSGDDLSVELNGHSHKRTSPGQQSPLIVSLSYHHEGTVSEDRFNLFPRRDDKSWRWRDYRFTIESYEYGESMTVTVERLGLRPLATN